MVAIYIACGLAYLVLGRYVLRPSPATDKRFAWLNVGFLFLAVYFTYDFPYLKRHFMLHAWIAFVFTAVYVTCIGLHYKLLKRAERDASAYTLAFWLPIGVLIAFKLMGLLANAQLEQAVWLRDRVLLLGVSYLSFKLSYSVWELKNGRIKLPGFYAYVGYALYVPTIFVGPINSLATQLGTRLPLPARLEEMRPHLLRIMVGLLKVTFLAGLVERLGYKALVTSAATTASIDYFIAPVANFLFLYLNFAGACDIVIALSALLGIYVKENFNNPFAARNVQDFWSRWHMTLSHYFKDIVFTPFTTWLTSKWGARHVNHCIAVGIMLVFLLIGLWHGTGMSFMLIGLIHGLAVVFNHYYGIGMKRIFGKSYKAFYNHPIVRWLSIFVTFYFISVTLLLVNYDVPTFLGCLGKMANILFNL